MNNHKPDPLKPILVSMWQKYSFVIAALILSVLFLKLLSNYSDTFEDIEKAYGEGTAINLSKGISEEGIIHLLQSQNYAKDGADARLIAGQLSAKINDKGLKLSTLSDLKKTIWQIPANIINTLGGPLLKERLDSSYVSLGIDEEYRSLNFQELSSTQIFGLGNGIIQVSVKAKNDSASFVKKALHKADTVCYGVVVRLSEHFLDSNDKPHRRTVAYLKTDKKGEVVFEGLDESRSYSVIPICKGFEYGTPQGTVRGNLSECAEDGVLHCKFMQQEHKIRLFDNLALRQIKEEHTMTIRSPQEFESQLSKYLIIFFAFWWGLFLWVSRKHKHVDKGIISILMLLTGFCLLMMFSINNPLTDELLGVKMAWGIIAGVVLIGLLLKVDFIKLYQDRLPLSFDIPLECVRMMWECFRWIFKPFKLKVRYLTNILSGKHNVIVKLLTLLLTLFCLPLLLLDLIGLPKLNDKVNILSAKFDSLRPKLPKGIGYLISALLLTALLWSPLGASVGGMKVNLDLGFFTFQPSEIAKYLIVIFMAAYFSVNANSIIKYSAKGNNTLLLGAKLKMMLSVILGLGVLMLMYFKLGDMGPALVLAFTFIILYSMIKSKIDLEGFSEHQQLVKILTCDLAMLVYGVVSFVAFLCAGSAIGNMWMGCISWFVVWIAVGITKKQVFESPVLFNLILAAFIFGGSVLSGSSVGERLQSRMEMCTNTWGTLPIDGMSADAGENTQVAEGLWALASGGLFGQGLGNGSPYFIPAFHTDMILESIGEQMGFIGIFVIILLMSLLLRKTILLGYRTSHPFAFYMCCGIAIVTAVQFIIISLGSTGIIPLTGVTVPFLSSGMVSMILNLAAFGIVLSIAKHNVIEEQNENTETARLRKQNICEYKYTGAILTCIYVCLAGFIAGVFLYYQVIDRKDTLVRPVYVNNADGVPVIEYNPRIKVLMRTLRPGDIYDRKGTLLATSDKTKLYDEKYRGLDWDDGAVRKRYYPFGEHLFFMLGDYNTRLFFSTDKWPRGYMAESRHLSDLRGFDDRRKDGRKDGKVLPKLLLSSSSYTPSRYFAPKYSIEDTVQLRDYAALVPFLKGGTNGNKVKRYNRRAKVRKIKPKDVHLTIDATLQKDLQEAMGRYFDLKGYKKQRISAVVLDANNGDLLASANYPLPDMDSLRLYAKKSYQDVEYSHKGKSYSDMDLGLLFATPPGSSAKIMSALAGFQKMGMSANQSIDIVKDELIAKYERTYNYYGRDKDMSWAIDKSSNVYFVKLVNENNLYPNLVNIYRHVGASLNQRAPYSLSYTDSSSISYFYDKSENIDFAAAMEKYHRFQEETEKKPLIDGTWMLAYGQGALDATPLAMARVASIAVNDGKMAATRYSIDTAACQIPIIKSEPAEKLADFMRNQAQNNQYLKHVQYVTEGFVGGKTGTAVREVKSQKTNIEDSWYICYIKGAEKNIAVAIRIERSAGNGSAVQLLKGKLLPILKKYVN